MDFGLFNLMGHRDRGKTTSEIRAETVIENCVDEIRRLRPTHTASFFQVGSFPHAKAMRSIERFAGEVVPGVEREPGPLAAA